MTADPGPARASQDRADAVAAAVLAVPGVARLHTGAFGEVGTYLPGRRVAGVRIRPDGVEVHVVVEHALLDRRVPLPVLAEQVHRAVGAQVPGPVHVYIDDLDEPPPPSV
ncbi:hypothetical protein [Georgenia sp. AZ-5]|uniref:hypothetical protein n=1 Tax=Georgenia sp. AZ-5 TaxID=3367526 RepID=UPI003755199D